MPGAVLLVCFSASQLVDAHQSCHNCDDLARNRRMNGVGGLPHGCRQWIAGCNWWSRALKPLYHSELTLTVGASSGCIGCSILDRVLSWVVRTANGSCPALPAELRSSARRRLFPVLASLMNA